MTSSRAPIVIAGPTACGKSALALDLAVELDGELVCADSRQLYQGMRIASAAPDDDERARAPHHLYESLPPEGAPMTAGAWAKRADEVIADVQSRGRVPILVGGTGLYLRAWRIGLEEPSDSAVRARIDLEATADLAAAYARLKDVDSDAADAIEPMDKMRIVRALEIFEVTGRPRGAVNPLEKPARAPAADATWLLLDAPLDVLEPRIRARAELMFATRAHPSASITGITPQGLDPPPINVPPMNMGVTSTGRDGTGGPMAMGPMNMGSNIVDEATMLAARLPPGHRLLETLGVREALDVASGRAAVAGAIAQTALRTRQYARRQRNWFKKEPWWQRMDLRSADVLVLTREHLRHRAH